MGIDHVIKAPNENKRYAYFELLARKKSGKSFRPTIRIGH